LNSIKYRPEIDGLRAIAVIPVILFHFNNELLPGGFIGVDVFFVISGFLITSIILKEYKGGTFSFTGFWLRRIRRILPALIVMVLTTLVVGTIFLYAPDISNLGTQGIASLLSFANISHWLIAGDYWGYAAETSPLLHTWSLSVEEQFYLFFPLLLILILKNFNKWLFFTFLAFSLLSVLSFIYGTKVHPTATFYLIPTRAWELGIGALLAILFFEKYLLLEDFTNNLFLSVIGISLILLSYVFISGEKGVSPFLIIPVFGATLTIAFAKDNLVNSCLSFPPVVYIGKISYSLYLWHWPVLVISKQLSLKHNVSFNSALILSVIFLISILSYHFIEVPTRRNNKIVPYILSLLFLGVGFSYILKISDYSEDISVYHKTEWAGRPYNVAPNREMTESGKKRMEGITISGSYNIDIKAYSNGGVKRIYSTTKTPEIVLLGDSHALMWAKVLDETAEELETSISFYAASGTRTFFNVPPIKMPNGTIFFNAEEKYSFDNARLKYIKKWKPKIVIISSKWSNVNIQETHELINYIGSIGSRILLIEQPPKLFFGDKNAPQYFSYLGLKPTNNSKQYVRYILTPNYQNGLNIVKQLAEKYDHCQHLAISDIFLYDGKVWVIDSFNALYIDDDHLSYEGTLKAKDRIVAAINGYL